MDALHKVKSDDHPISIFFRVCRRLRVILEQRWPNRWIRRRMLRGLKPSYMTDDRIVDRFGNFSANTPFSEVDFLRLTSPEERRMLKLSADQFLQHRFDLLGSGPVDLGEKIDWHRDFVTGFRWSPSALYSSARNNASIGSDIKRPWELSRCQHYVALGLAWQLSGCESYLREFVSETTHWIAQNPVGYGVNWACPMDVAIRSVNWLVAYALFRGALSGNDLDSFARNLTVSLWEHGRFVRTHLEWNGPVSERRANHFLADIVGLFTLGLFFADTNSGRSWIRFSHKWLEHEIRRQVLNDGVHFECSISYHRLCLEMFLWSYCLGAKHGVHFSEEYGSRLERMQLFCSAYARPDGMSPLLGDNDDGRFILSGLGQINDHRYLWKGAKKGAHAVDAALLAGNNGMTSKESPSPGLIAFESSGFYVFRRPDMYSVIRAGRHAHMGAHAHCDQLSFELFIKGSPVFVDRGTYVYTSDPEKRNLYRSTRAHNTISINGAEQNRSVGKARRLLDDTQAEARVLARYEIISRHTGFKSLQRKDIAHQRSYRFAEAEPFFEICDNVNGLQSGDSIEWFFHLAPGLSTEWLEDRVLIKKEDQLVCWMKFPSGIRATNELFCHSPSYGKLVEAETLRFNACLGGAEREISSRYLVEWKVKL